MQVKAAKNDDESSIVLTSIVITEHDLYWTAGQHDLGILPCTCTSCNTSVTTREVGVAGASSV